ncbi:FKBP-type peptidyl-prolyl cis-trans isomerase [Candidatus Pacearchaeota archaeon]|nr:FKBP-type peptidyl-prolyl cis-trans isomerase [Candidatus Pacearchaeota archaeon]
MPLQKNDFIEIEFTARVKDTAEVFDTNIKEDLEKSNSKSSVQAKPFVFPLGYDFFLKGVEDFLLNKSDEKFPSEYNLDLSPENAFGKRDSSLIRRIPTKIFREQKINPVPGVIFNFDGKMAKVLAVSGGRVIVDFNHPIAGKDVSYKIKVIRKISELDEKIHALMDFFYRKEFDFEISDKEKNKKLIIKLKQEEKQYKQFLELFKDKFKEILDLDLEVEFAGEDSEKEEKDKKEDVAKR